MINPSFEKLTLLRALMKDLNIDAYIIPSTDPHLGEYVPDYWRVIAWLTGFTGSSATVVVTDLFAGLWTDSRYFVQAENQLAGSGFVLMKPVLPDKKDFIDWLIDIITPGNKIALDGRTFPVDHIRRIEKLFKGKNVSFDNECDLISGLWNNRPPMPNSIAFDHPVVFCGKERAVKITEVRELMKKQDINYHLLTSIDDIMWLLNIRGSDIRYSPLMTSFAIIGEKQILLFADESKIPLKLASEFDKLDIVMLPYEETSGMLSTLPSGSSILVTPGTTSASLFNSIDREINIKEDISIPTRLKAVKNKVEIENIGKVMVKDGVALTKLFYWLEQNSDLVPMSELSLTKKLNDYRSDQENYLGPSFSTIAAFDEHGALPHYSATSDTDAVLSQKGILLIDSGGQYHDGTTDITRTISIGIPNSRQKKDFTLVLKGAISLAQVKFPAGTRGYQLDILARKALWEQGLNYGHGTGHGVGFCLNVHEGPHNIGTGSGTGSKSIIEAGMLFSNEPAIYREGEYGIRTENLILCYEDEETEFGKFLKFDTVSLCYIDRSLMDISMLDQKEIDWLNTYHAEVYHKLSPYLTEDERTWLKEKTESI
ncbi:MAG TPA: aminopeptidase P family protein [Bacteroidales bacterium]|nr:aminopeptidase P family protein [Bacteroidales bacterium]